MNAATRTAIASVPALLLVLAVSTPASAADHYLVEPADRDSVESLLGAYEGTGFAWTLSAAQDFMTARRVSQLCEAHDIAVAAGSIGQVRVYQRDLAGILGALPVAARGVA